ncbi:S8 family serine peptidase [Bordetella sp. LUAb4]|uniref:S8 family serine peptidase n=1 Tax=Bordetella sp. LUAb4 TaxID=2843195 RepID=UPI001E47F776|nr:S8 family serine peptidase [Bordetella sp. LUAb4]
MLALAQAGQPPVLDDPLYQYQWHLKNTGQRVFGDTLPTAGIDLNIGSLHERGITGKGVVVAVVENGRIDVAHEDLAANLFARDSLAPAHMCSHATQMAGIIAAVAGNGKGGRGVAPEATIVDLLAPGASNAPPPRLYNESLGTNRPFFTPYSGSGEAHRDVETRAGATLIKSAGNGFLAGHQIGLNEDQCRDVTRGTGIGCINAATQRKHAEAQVITVGAMSAFGKKASYSETGSVLWVSGLGGEHGYENAMTGLAYDTRVFNPAIVTTDASGLRFGNNRDLSDMEPRNRLDRGGESEIDPTGNYTAQTNGTSAAAATVTGVAALMLQANPALTWRDIKYILATTARKVDPEQGKIDFDGLRLDDGWVTNAAGRAFSNWYGFGLVDATAAVEAARTHTLLGPLRDSRWLETWALDTPVALASTPDPVGAPIVFHNDVAIETVQLRLRTTHKIPYGLQIQLTSPSGTKSIVLPALTYLKDLDGGSFSIDLTASNAFLDESARGTWTLQVIDIMNRLPRSEITSWELRVLGRTPPAPRH